MTTNANLEAGRAKIAQMRADGWKPEQVDPLEKARRNPGSLRLAVNAKCWDCHCGDADPAPRWRIGNCQIPDCPLWLVRPYQSQAGRTMPVALRATVE